MNLKWNGKGIRAAALTACCPIALPAADLRSCRAVFDGHELTIANSHVERKWRVDNGLLYATSLRDIDTKIEWLARPSVQPSPYPPMPLPDEPRQAALTQRAAKAGPVEAESLIAELVTTGQTRLRYRFQIFPDARGVSIQLTAEGASGAASLGDTATTGATGIEVDRPVQNREAKFIPDTLELLDLAPQHLRLTEVRLADQTDVHNELVFEQEWLLHTSEGLWLPGNLFLLENTLTGNGLIFLKEAPLPHARPVKSGADLSYDPQNHRVGFLGHGVAGPGEGYRYVTLAYSGGRLGRIEALQRYQRQLRVYDSSRDGKLLTNTWGDRSRDARINEDFLTKEVEAGKRLGADAIQIDDGWELGRTANSVRANGVWSGFWAANPNFWDVDPQRFPHGLKPVVHLATEAGMGFGLWFAPDSSKDFANWQKDADKILELHRTLGVDYIKIDGVKAPTKASEHNLRRFFDRVLEQSKGRVTFDLDVTAEIRPGYFGMINVGPLFVENRYTDWHRYWPHQTLRNLWKLAQYVDPLRLRMEFLNNTRNPQTYPDDPLAPATYSSSYLFAAVMLSNPLGWFEISSLPAEYVENARPLIARWKQERPTMFSGTIAPIGSAPDGVAWTGFVVRSSDAQLYVLIFREMNQSADWECDLPWLVSREYSAVVLGGRGSVSGSAGKLRVHIPDIRQFVWARLQGK